MENKRILITGGAGFIGFNASSYFHESGYQVHVLDNLSRTGTEVNWNNFKKLGIRHLHHLDIRDKDNITNLFKKYSFDIIIHLAAQVAVTTSIVNPMEDFEINAIGTINLLEASRIYKNPPIFIYSSTNKVYGKLNDHDIIEGKNRYVFKTDTGGIPESQTLDFYSPYGCSKGSADQYVIDYSRIYGIKSVVFRQSCIYGRNQLGVEDQGWVAWFLIRNILQKPVTIFGDGKQVRDILYIDDLVRLYSLAIEKIDSIQGNAFNIGGGTEFSVSLLECIDLIQEISKKKFALDFDNWRAGDQKIFISDNGKINNFIGWRPTIAPVSGIQSLHDWICRNIEIIEKYVG